MSANLGMGLNSALADAQVLGTCASASCGDPAAVATAYNAARLRDVHTLSRISRKLNDAVNHPYHGDFWKLLWGAPVYLSLIAGIVLRSPKAPSTPPPVSTELVYKLHRATDRHLTRSRLFRRSALHLHVSLLRSLDVRSARTQVGLPHSYRALLAHTACRTPCPLVAGAPLRHMPQAAAVHEIHACCRDPEAPAGHDAAAARGG